MISHSPVSTLTDKFTDRLVPVENYEGQFNYPQDITAITGRTGSGRSTLAVDILCQWIKENGGVGAILSPESRLEDLMFRIQRFNTLSHNDPSSQSSVIPVEAAGWCDYHETKPNIIIGGTYSTHQELLAELALYLKKVSELSIIVCDPVQEVDSNEHHLVDLIRSLRKLQADQNVRVKIVLVVDSNDQWISQADHTIWLGTRINSRRMGTVDLNPTSYELSHEGALQFPPSKRSSHPPIDGSPAFKFCDAANKAVDGTWMPQKPLEISCDDRYIDHMRRLMLCAAAHTLEEGGSVLWIDLLSTDLDGLMELAKYHPRLKDHLTSYISSLSGPKIYLPIVRAQNDIEEVIQIMINAPPETSLCIMPMAYFLVQGDLTWNRARLIACKPPSMSLLLGNVGIRSPTGSLTSKLTIEKMTTRFHLRGIGGMHRVVLNDN